MGLWPATRCCSVSACGKNPAKIPTQKGGIWDLAHVRGGIVRPLTGLLRTTGIVLGDPCPLSQTASVVVRP